MTPKTKISPITLQRKITSYEKELIRYSVSNTTSADVQKKFDISQSKVSMDLKTLNMEFASFIARIRLNATYFVDSILKDGGNIMYGWKSVQTTDPILWYTLNIAISNYFDDELSFFEVMAYVKMVTTKYVGIEYASDMLSMINSWEEIKDIANFINNMKGEK